MAIVWLVPQHLDFVQYNIIYFEFVYFVLISQLILLKTVLI